MSINNHLNFHPISFSASESQDLEVTYPSPSSTDTQLQLQLLRRLATAQDVNAYIADLRKSGQEGLIPRFFLMDAQNSTSKSLTPSSSSVHSNKTLSERQISPLPPSSSITSEASFDYESDQELPQDEEFNDTNPSDALPSSSSSDKSPSHKRKRSSDSLDLLLKAGLAADVRESSNEASSQKKTSSSQKKKQKKHQNQEILDGLIKEAAVSKNITQYARDAERLDMLGNTSIASFKKKVTKYRIDNGLVNPNKQSAKIRKKAASATEDLGSANRLTNQNEQRPQGPIQKAASFSQHSNQTSQAASKAPPLPSSLTNPASTKLNLLQKTALAPNPSVYATELFRSKQITESPSSFLLKALELRKKPSSSFSLNSKVTPSSKAPHTSFNEKLDDDVTILNSFPSEISRSDLSHVDSEKEFDLIDLTKEKPMLHSRSNLRKLFPESLNDPYHLSSKFLEDIRKANEDELSKLKKLTMEVQGKIQEPGKASPSEQWRSATRSLRTNRAFKQTQIPLPSSLRAPDALFENDLDLSPSEDNLSLLPLERTLSGTEFVPTRDWEL